MTSLKIHKIHNPGRPVISSVNSNTEKISARVHEFLRPIVERLFLYTRDRLHSTNKSHGKTTRRMLFSTLDVSSFYTNICIDEGLSHCYSRRTHKNKPGQAIVSDFNIPS